MNNSDRLNLPDFAIGPELESYYDFDDLYDFDFKENQNKITDETDSDDLDEFIWDDV